jgi:hypothetical protein
MIPVVVAKQSSVWKGVFPSLPEMLSEKKDRPSGPVGMEEALYFVWLMSLSPL